MKAALLYIAIIALSLLIVPMIALNFNIAVPTEVQAPTVDPAIESQDTTVVEREISPTPRIEWQEAELEAEATDVPTGPTEMEEPAFSALESDIPSSEYGVNTFRILDQSSGEVVEVALRDFVRGAVAAEMPVSFHLEALKAQAVAAHTFAVHNHWVQQETPDPALAGADFAADPQNLKVYITEEIAREFYGDRADIYWNKICSAADSVLPYVLEYEDEPIVAAYHAISAGQTEDAANVWTGSAPYLLPAESGGDLLAPDYQSQEVVSVEELRALLATAHPEVALGEDPADWFGEPVRSGSGYVTEIPVGDSTLEGKEIRQLLDLRSHNFDIGYTDAGFRFTVYGYGHGVGLSQYGADYLARQGRTFDEILANYYSGATLKQVAVPEDEI